MLRFILDFMGGTMDINEINLEALKLYRPVLYDVITRKKEMDIIEDLFITKTETRDGSFALCINKDSETIRLNSAYRPLEEARKWAEGYSFPNLNTVIEVFGLGNGVFIRELIGRIKGEDDLIIYEPNVRIFTFCLENFDISDILKNPNVYLFIEGLNEKNIEDCLLQKNHWYNMDFQRQIVHPQYLKFEKEKYEWFCETINNNNELLIINKNTDSFLGKLSVNNILKNIKYLIGSNIISEIREKLPNDVPAIIVSAGPSLQKNIDYLKEAKGRSVIICVDTAIPYLEAHNIEPDILITIDPRKSMWHFRGSYAKEIPIISKLEAKPEILDNNEARKIFYSSHNFMDKLYNEIGVEIQDYTSGGSVATAAFSVCVALEFKRIIFVGQDLSYEGEFTHMGGRKENFTMDLGIREVEGIDGTSVKTRYDWFIYLNWFENSIYSNPQIDFIDATEGGAKIHGTKIMTLKEVIETYCIKEFEIADIIQNTEPTLDAIRQEKISNYLHEAFDDLNIIQKKSEEILNLIYKMISIYKLKGVTKEVQNCTNKITQVSGDIENKNVYAIIETYMAEFSRNNLGDIYRFDTKDGDDTLRTFHMARDTYQNMIEATKELEPLLQKSVEEYDQRMGK